MLIVIIKKMDAPALSLSTFRTGFRNDTFCFSCFLFCFVLFKSNSYIYATDT